MRHMRKKVIICSIAVVAVTAIIILGVGLTRDFIDSQNTINIPDTTTTIIDVTTDEWSIGTDMFHGHRQLHRKDSTCR